MSNSSTSHDQTALPKQFGGLGLRKYSSLSFPYFLSSTHTCSTLVSNILSSPKWTSFSRELDESLQNWRKFDLSAPEKVKDCWSQRDWDNVILKTTFYSFFMQSDQFSRCGLLLLVWNTRWGCIDAIIVANVGGLLSLDEFHVSIAFRILEASGLLRCDGKRVVGLNLCLWSQSRCLVWNVTVSDSFVSSHILDAAVRTRSTDSVAEQNKILK